MVRKRSKKSKRSKSDPNHKQLLERRIRVKVKGSQKEESRKSSIKKLKKMVAKKCYRGSAKVGGDLERVLTEGAGDLPEGASRLARFRRRRLSTVVAFDWFPLVLVLTRRSFLFIFV